MKRAIRHHTLSIITIGIMLLSFYPSVSRAQFRLGISDTIQIYGSNDFPPYEFVDDKGMAAGFNVDIMKTLMHDLALPYKITVVTWSSVLQAYKDGKADIIMGMSFSPERAKTYRFGLSYASIYQNAIYRQGSPPIRKFEQLRGKKVMIEKGDLLEDLARSNGLSKEIVFINNYDSALRVLSAGQADALLCSGYVARFYMNKAGITNLELKDLEVFPKEYGYATQNSHLLTAMDGALMRMKENGTYEKIYNKWFTDYTAQHIFHFIYWLIAGLILSIVIFYLFIYLLRRKVNAAKQIISSQTLRLKLAIKAGKINVWEYNVKQKIFLKVYYSDLPEDGISYDEAVSLIYPDDRQLFVNTIESLAHGDTTPERIRLRKKSVFGSKWRNIEMEFAQVLNKDGEVESVIGTNRDITNQIAILHQLESEKEKAQAADRLKSAFLANMSHEIRTPLNSIVGFSNLLQSTTDEERKKAYVRIINTNSDLLLQLINDILDLSEIESGVVKLQEEEFDFAISFNEITAALSQRCTSPDVQFTAINPYQNYVIRADHRRISQLLYNFGTNAIKYTPKGTIKMGYSFEDGGLRLYVEDTGIGISESEKDRIFKRFEKLNDFAQGTGLGLSICKAITDTYNGKIGFTSQKGEGSTFWAWLPVEGEGIGER